VRYTDLGSLVIGRPGARERGHLLLDGRDMDSHVPEPGIDDSVGGISPVPDRWRSPAAARRRLEAMQVRNSRSLLPVGVAWLGSRVVSVLDSGAEGPRFRSQPRRCRVTVLGKLFTPIVPLFTKQHNL